MSEQNISDLKKQKDKYITKIFWLCLQIAFIFGIPAVLGAIIGGRLDAKYGTENKITLAILFGTFVFSWMLVVFLYRRISKKVKEVEDQIKIKKEELLKEELK
jgi:O-antigen/teichoic acid export membrane protein